MKVPAKTPALNPPPISPPAGRLNPAGPAPPSGPPAPASPAGRAALASGIGSLAAGGRELARPYAALALARLAEMINDPDPKVAFPACREVLDRAWGKAEAALKAGEEGGLKWVVIRGRETEDD